MAIKLRVRCLRKCGSVLLMGVLNLIEQCAEGGPWPRVSDEVLPHRITIQLRQESRQRRDELFALHRRKTADRRLDFLYAAHDPKLP